MNLPHDPDSRDDDLTLSEGDTTRRKEPPDHDFMTLQEGTLLEGVEGTLAEPSSARTEGPRATEAAGPRGAEAPPDASDAGLRAGANVGSYRLQKVVGQGAQGNVWHAYNEVAERDFALKFINTNLLRKKWASDAFRSEAAVLFQLTHPGVVRLNNIEQVGPHLFLVMELLAGPSLQRVLRDRIAAKGDRPPIDVAECLWILERLAPALDYAAAEGVTHRDIKPGNVMFTMPFNPETKLTEAKTGVKVCDFGIAFVEDQVDKTGKVSPSGTPGYMAPEVMDGARPDHRADIYSLAATLYHLHTGSLPVKPGTLAELRTQLERGDTPPLQSGDRAFDAAIMRGMSTDPEDRQASFDELLFEASNGTMGLRAAGHAPWTRRVAIAATVLAAGAVAFALDPFALRRGKAEFLPAPEHQLLDGARVVTAQLHEVQFDYRSPGDEEVRIFLDEQLLTTVGPDPGEDRYRTTISLAEVKEGPHRVRVMTAEADVELGQLELLVDRSVGLDDPALSTAGGPFPQRLGVEVTIRTTGEEDVWVRELRSESAPEVLVPAGTSRGSYQYAIPQRTGKARWSEQVEFGFRDAFGNLETRTLSVEVYTRDAILAKLREARPGPLDLIHPWDRAQYEEDLGGWLESVEGSSLQDGEKEVFREEFRGAMAELNDAMKRWPAAEISLELESEDYHVEGAGDDPVLHTRHGVVSLQGSTTDARSAAISARVTTEGAGIEITRTPQIDRLTQRFELSLALEPGADGNVQLALLEGGGRVQNIRVVHDGAEPSIRWLSPTNGATLGADHVTVSAEVEDDGSGIASVLLIGTGAEPIPMQQVRDTDEWRASTSLPRDGEFPLRIDARDRSGLVSQSDLIVSRDMTAPVLQLQPSAGSARTGQELALAWRFDEPISTANATLRYTSASGPAEVTELVPICRGAEVTLAVTLPFQEGLERLNVELNALDVMHNTSTASLSVPITHDPWGAAPEAVRQNADLIVDPAELKELLGRQLSETPYVPDGAAWFPRCIRDTRTGVVFVYVPSGSFQFGPTASGVQVTMDGFYIARTEISVSQFRRGAKGNSRLERVYASAGANWEPVVTNRGDAQEWCNHHTRPTDETFRRSHWRLPTEAQWEYAASGPDNNIYPWGDGRNPSLRNGPTGSPFDVTNLGDVDGFAGGRSWCGALQMAGNAAELCWDLLDPPPTKGSLNPRGRESDFKEFVVRGGSHRTAEGDEEKTHGRSVRYSSSASDRRNGFRPVWVLPNDQ